jgi:hypothetical protein
LENLYQWMRPKEPLDCYWDVKQDQQCCNLCKTSFGYVFNRKLFCRGCGVVACSACIPERSFIMNFDQEMPVCPTCTKRLANDGTHSILYL